MFQISHLRFMRPVRAARTALVAFGIAVTLAAPLSLATPAPAAHAASWKIPAWASQPASTTSSSTAAAARGNRIVSTAMKYVGYRYRFGGASPSGFDCTGFVYYVMNRAGYSISRNMYAQLASGTRVSSSNLQPGDLVFFSNTYKRGLSHAGIYIGGGKFINAANENTGVVVSNLWSSYWGSHFSAAVRPR